MNDKQKAGMIQFHKKAEMAYLKFGQKEKAEQARKMRERLESKE